ncbi:hypothetical protein [Streptomyces sp. NBC_01546]|uniref:hypothetical protein n=1 Tax=Streptomyces sp. NBC_01546 TaxID=2975872 RepID=UPI003867AF33
MISSRDVVGSDGDRAHEMAALQPAARAQPAASFDEFFGKQGSEDVRVDDDALWVEAPSGRGPGLGTHSPAVPLHTLTSAEDTSDFAP